MTAIHQFLPVFAPGDAIGNHVLRIRRILRDAGYESEIFAGDIHHPVRRHARPFTAFSPSGAEPVWLLYHLSTGSVMADWLTQRPEPLMVDYHNITPPEYFDRWAPEAAEINGKYLADREEVWQGRLISLLPAESRASFKVLDERNNKFSLAQADL